MNEKIKKKCESTLEKAKKEPYKYGFWCITVLLLIPVLIWFLYFIGDNIGIVINTSLTVGDALGFYAALLAFLGTVLLGAIAVIQNSRLQKLEENNYSRSYGCNILLENNDKESKDEIFLSNDGDCRYQDSIIALHLKIKNYSDAFLKRMIIEFLDSEIIFMSYVTVAKNADKMVRLCIPKCLKDRGSIKCKIQFVSCYDSVTYADFRIKSCGRTATMHYYHFYGDKGRQNNDKT